MTHDAPENSPLQSHRLQAKERAVSGRADLLKPAKACYNLLSLLQCRVSDERSGTADETLMCGRGKKGGAFARLKGALLLGTLVVERKSERLLQRNPDRPESLCFSPLR